VIGSSVNWFVIANDSIIFSSFLPFSNSKLTSQCLLYRIASLYYFLSLSSNMSKIALPQAPKGVSER